MSDGIDRRFSRCRAFSKFTGVAAAVVGVLALAGWTFDIAALKSVSPNMVAMNPATAVNFALAGLALCLSHYARMSRVGCGTGLFVAVVGVAKLGENFGLIDTGIDQFLFRSKLDGNVMAFNTALAFALVGLAICFLDAEMPGGNRPADGFALFTAFLGLFAMVGYVYGVQSFYAFGSYYPMALPTAVTFGLLAFGILCARPDRGMINAFTGEDAGSLLVRRLLPITIVILCLVDWLQLAGARRGYYSGEFGDALQTSIDVTILSLLIWWSARRLQIIDRKRRLAEGDLAVTLHSIGDAVMATDTAGRVTRLNPVAEKLTGWTHSEALGRPVAEVFHIINEVTREPAVIPVEKVLATGEIHGLANHTVIVARGGAEHPIADSAAPIRDKDRGILGVVLVFRDVTEEKKAERNQKWLAAIIESSGDAIISKTLDGIVTSWNPGAEQLFGYTAAEMIGQPITRLSPADRIDEEPKLLALLKNGERVDHFETVRLTKDGRKLDVSATISPIRDGAGHIVGISTIVRDITEHKRSEEELRRFNESLENLVAQRTTEMRQALLTLDATEDGAFIFDPETLVHTYVNKGAIQQLGYSREELLCMTPVHYKPEFTEARYRELLAPMLLGEVRMHRFTTIHRHKEGRDFPVEIHLQYVVPAGERPRFIAIVRDITERRKAEQQAFRSQRLESIGTLAGGIAHDLNNAIAPILMGVEMIKAEYPDESQIVEIFESSARRAADMVRQLVSFAKGAEGERIPLSVGRLLKEMEKIMRGSFPKDIRLVVKCDPKLPKALGDATQLHQVLLNLCVNARDAMPHGGTLTMEAERRDVDALYASSVPGAKPGEYVAVRVQDTGMGICPEIIERIFDPFFTTKGPEKGTGLGLSTVMGIVKGHGGFIQVYSQLGQGSSFTVYLPVDNTGGDTEHFSRPVPAFRGQGETVLFVDDEPSVREIARAVLRRLNCKPLTAADGADALIQAAQNRSLLSAIITDLHMPHMDGLQFVRTLRRMLPDIPILLVSGRMEEGLAKEFRALGVNHHLDKPFTEAQLAEALNRLFPQKQVEPPQNAAQ